jgi:hypothetical protein
LSGIFIHNKNYIAMKKNKQQGAEAFPDGLAQQDPLCDLSPR